jgi:hypothetical protein
MRRRATYRPAAWLLLLLLASCTLHKEAGIDWSVTLDHEQTTPYGSSIAYKTMQQYFPAARREPLTRWFRYTSVDERMHGGPDSAALLVMLGLDYYVTEEEWLGVLQFAGAGNEVFLLSSSLDYNVLRSLGCQKIGGGNEEYPLSRYNDGSDAEHALRLMPDTTRAYGFTGRSIGSYFKLQPPAGPDTVFKDKIGETSEPDPDDLKLVPAIDTTAQVLGLTAGKPDFIRYRVGDGHISLHAAPLVLSNYFLLQPGNREYLDAIWHSLPANISVVYWNEYYKRTTEKSNMNVLLKYPATRWALIIAVCTLLLYVLFGLKRIQRIVPILPPVENASVSFVETVGRLYFNKGDHANLAGKMTQHFLEWVRSHYYLDTSELNEAFARRLAAKSGKPEAEVNALLNRIHELRLGAVDVTPEYLYELYRSIQSFYKTR